LRRIVHVDHGWGFHPSLGRDDRSHCCENDHRRKVSRYGNSPNAAMKPALTKGKHRHRAWWESALSSGFVPSRFSRSGVAMADTVIHRAPQADQIHAPIPEPNVSGTRIRDTTIKRDGHDRTARQAGSRAGRNQHTRC
jgi:hypothetical protein